MTGKRPWFVRPATHPFAVVRDSLPRRLRVEIIDRQGGLCAACGCVLAPGSTEIDHDPPLALRSDMLPANDMTGLQALCSPCHAAKTRIDLARIAKTKRQAQREADHVRIMELKVPGRPRPPASVRRWVIRRPP